MPVIDFERQVVNAISSAFEGLSAEGFVVAYSDRVQWITGVSTLENALRDGGRRINADSIVAPPFASVLNDGVAEGLERLVSEAGAARKALGENRPCRYVESFSFGFTPADALEIAALVLSGTKTATGSVLRSYEADKKRLPIAGDHWIVIVDSDTPVCIIETTQVQIMPFDELPEDYAWEGGEGDRSLATPRVRH